MPPSSRIIIIEESVDGDIMQALPGFTRKYAIMEELDEGFGEGSKPEAFVRLDSWEGSINASLHVKGLKQGPFRYMLYLVFLQGDQLTAIPAGTVGSTMPGAQGNLQIEADALRKQNARPEQIRYAAITAESNDKKWIPLFSSFEKTLKWDESIRQAIYRKQQPEQAAKPAAEDVPKVQPSNMRQPDVTPERKPADNVRQFEALPENKPAEKETAANEEAVRHATFDPKLYKCDCDKLETLIKNNFDPTAPFKGGNRDYIWYTVNDLAKLSNIMFMSGVNVPVFANPKILVGLFRYKHILAGIYKGENNSRYFVIGIPARDETDNRPFENACRWVAVKDSEVRDMGGYWLVYVSLRSGEIVV